MTVLLIILVIILFLILLFLFSDLSFVFLYNNEFSFKIKFLFLNISAETIMKFSKKREQENRLEEARKTNEKKFKKHKKTPSDIIDVISYISGVVKSILGEFVRYAKLKFCKVKISIGTDDAATTALSYGFISSGIYTALEFLDSFLAVKKQYKNIGVVANFTSTDCHIDLKIILKLKIIHLVLAALHILPSLSRTEKGK